MTDRLSSDLARLYTSLRTAHLERAHELPPAAIVYRGRRYDFDESLLAGLDITQVTTVGAALLLARSRLRVLEVNEPLMVSSLRMTALAVAAVRLRGLLTRQRVTIVTYAISNLDPWSAGRPTLRSRLRRRSEQILARYLWSQIDRVCFGTEAAAELHHRLLGGTRATQTLVPALPVALEPDAQSPTDPNLVVFLGALVPRKGIDRVLASWPLVRAQVPTARLEVLGKGALEAQVLAAAEADPSLTVVLDPPRSVIAQTLRRAQVLALPSQPTPTWREQVGLPIVEALAAGCTVVTTTETGLADWLAAHGHSVIAPGGPPEALADAIIEQLRIARPAAEVLADLPAVDGRLAADSWMFDRPDQPPAVLVPGAPDA